MANKRNSQKYPVSLGSKLLIADAVLVAGALIGLVAWYMMRHNVAVFNAQGIIADREKRLILITLSLSLVVVIPVFAMMIIFAWKYREGNKAAKYSPELDGNRWAETIWWLLPVALISILSVITWQSTHELDPFKPLASSKKPLTIQVVALQWKWLFIYPEQHVASVNFAQVPTNRPLNFQITSDAPMNSFWVPQLGGQIYAMSGMSVPLHLEASNPGNYQGVSANISGKGFSDMRFTVRASSDDGFASWVRSVKESPQQLDLATYNKLAKPSDDTSITAYAPVDPDLYNTVVMKYMMPGLTNANNDLTTILRGATVPLGTYGGSTI